MARFQVVIPNLNQGAFVGEAIASVLGQLSVDVQVVVVDGGSTDDSLTEIAQAIGSDDRATVISEPDRGQSDAINKGARLGDGEIVSWLNADDRLLSGSLSRIERAFASADDAVVAIYGDVRYIDENGDVISTWREQDFDRGDLVWGPGYIPQPSTFVRRWAWEQCGGVRDDLHYVMDMDLWIRLSRVGQFLHLPEVLSEFRWHATSKTIAFARAMNKEAMQIKREHGALELGRVPPMLEVNLRNLAVRARRRITFRFRGLGTEK